MKKVILLFVVLVFTCLAFAQDVLVQYWAGDASFNFVNFVGPDAQPAEDGWVLEYYVSVDGVIDGLDPVTRLPLGDDLLAVNQENGYFMDALNGGMFTGTPGQWYASSPVQTSDPVGSPAEPVINLGDFFYIVLYNNAVIGDATHYLTSEMITAESSGGPFNIGINVWNDWIPFGGGPTPVVLSDFSYAVFANQFVQISWTTQSSVNMSMWNLYRDNEIIHQEAAVNGTEPYSYIFQDTEVTPGETYTYYLEAIDYDGTSTTFDAMDVLMEGEIIPDLPDATLLKGNYPNPFNPVTSIKFDVKDGENAKLTIFDVKGRVIETASYGPGFNQEHVWESTNASGVYFYKLESSSHTSVRKMLLLK